MRRSRRLNGYVRCIRREGVLPSRRFLKKAMIHTMTLRPIAAAIDIPGCSKRVGAPGSISRARP
jgi:hypothetical protein